VERKQLTKGDLTKSFLCWSAFAQTCYNYERLQALGFCHAMVPILKRLYKTQEQMAAALKRHLVFFNTEVNWGSIVPGVVAALEEERANNPESVTDEMINGVKTGLMGPLAGVGDTVTQGLVKTILLAIGVDFASKGSAFGPVIFLVLMTAYALAVGYLMYMQGYKLGKQAIPELLKGGLVQRVTEGLNALGMVVVGALIATRVPVKTPITIVVGKTTVALQALLNQILPGMLGLALVFAAWSALRKAVTRVLAALCVLGIVAGLLGILS